jgi:hypothetical protein
MCPPVPPPPPHTHTQVSALQSALERSQASEATLTSRLAELNSQLASSSMEGGSLRAQNGELLSELAALRCVGLPHAWTICASVPVAVTCVLDRRYAGCRRPRHMVAGVIGDEAAEMSTNICVLLQAAAIVNKQSRQLSQCTHHVQYAVQITCPVTVFGSQGAATAAVQAQQPSVQVAPQA